MIMGCNLLPVSSECIQIDIVPHEDVIYPQGQKTQVDVAVCSCFNEGPLCDDQNLKQNVSLNISASIGTVSKEVVYLLDGRGSVFFYGSGEEEGIATLEGNLGSFYGKAEVEFTENIPFESFTLQASQTEVKAGSTPILISSFAAPSYEGQEFKLFLYPPDVGNLESENNINQASNGSTTFLYIPPEESSGTQIVQAIAQSGLQLSNTIEIKILSDKSFSIQPFHVDLPLGESITFRLLGDIDTPVWMLPSNVYGTCNGGEFSDCKGEKEVVISIVEYSCYEEECPVTFWVIDDETGEQVSATINIQ